METSVTLSVERMLQRIYAHSALATYMNHREREIPMLSPDNRLALARMVVDAFADIALTLIPLATECTLPDDATDPDNDLMTLTFDAETLRSPALPAFRASLESAVASKVIAAIFAEYPELSAATGSTNPSGTTNPLSPLQQAATTLATQFPSTTIPAYR